MARLEDLRWDEKGLVPAVVQDADTGEVLTVAYMNRQSLAKTRESGETVFWSRSRNSLWRKGETSGHVQKVVGVTADCDLDALVVRVRAQGPACHTGARSCFFEPLEGFDPCAGPGIGGTLAALERLIGERNAQRPEGSYTSKLFDGGLNRILQKVGEEAVETILAGATGSRTETVRECADLLYHLLVALSAMGIPLAEVSRELESRGRPR